MNSYIPDRLYCSFSNFYKTGTHNINLLAGYMTPDGTDKSSVRRKKTIQAAGNKDYTPLTFENKPLHGFKFHSFKSAFTGNECMWIADPRGFVTKIKMSNFCELLTHATIHNGEIIKECVWIRHGRYNKLITTDSPQYRKSLKTTEGLRHDYKFKDLKVNDIVTLKDKSVGRYLGSFNIFGLIEKEDSTTDLANGMSELKNIIKVGMDKSRYRCILINTDGKEKVLLYKSFTIINIEKISNNIDILDDYEDWLNLLLNNSNNNIKIEYRTYFRDINSIIGFTSKKTKTINYNISLNPIILSAYVVNNYTNIKTILTKYRNEYYCLHKNYSFKNYSFNYSNNTEVMGNKVEMILQGSEIYSYATYINNYGNRRYITQVRNPKTQKEFRLDDIKLYSIVVIWDNVITKKTYKRVCI